MTRISEISPGRAHCLHHTNRICLSSSLWMYFIELVVGLVLRGALRCLIYVLYCDFQWCCVVILFYINYIHTYINIYNWPKSYLKPNMNSPYYFFHFSSCRIHFSPSALFFQQLVFSYFFPFDFFCLLYYFFSLFVFFFFW